MSIQDKAAELVEDFGLFDDWMDRYNYIIELGKSLEEIDEKYKDKRYLISGCQSQLWLGAEYRDGKVWFQADSDAIITKGIAYLLVHVMNGEKPADILDNDLEFINQIGLKEHLSPTRSNGLTSMIKQIRMYALVFKTKAEQQNS